MESPTKRLKATEPQIPRRKLGRTDMEVSVIGFGAASLVCSCSYLDRSLCTIETALTLEITRYAAATGYCAAATGYCKTK